MDHGTRQLVNTEQRTILCPRCEEEQPMRDFATLGMSPLYTDALNPIFRCKLCNHLFAPRHRHADSAPELAAQSVNGAAH